MNLNDFFDQQPEQSERVKGNLGKTKSLEDFFPAEEQPVVAQAKKPERTVLGTVGDVANAAAQTVIGTGEALVGLANIPTMGRAGKFLEEKLGYDPKASRKILDDALKSDAQREADKNVDKAEGFTGTLKALGENPSVIARTVAEQVGPMLLGGAGAKLAKAAGVGGVKAAAAGEGAIAAGSSAESIRQETETGDLTLGQTLTAAGSGALTGLLGYGGGLLAKKLGIADIDQFVAGVSNADEVAKKNIFSRILGGAVSEGVLEELPQSIQEQMAQNFALDRPIMDGVDKAAAMGLAAGAVMGGGTQLLSSKPSAPAAGGNQKEPQEDGPTTSRQLADFAFAQVRGDDGVLGQQETVKAQLAVALSQLDDTELEQATTHIANGNEELKSQLFSMARDENVVASAKQAFGNDVLQYVGVADAIRRDAGITPVDTKQAPSATQIGKSVNQQIDLAQQQAVDQQQTAVTPPVNSAGFVPEPTGQLRAQLAAVADGSKPAAIMGVDDAERVNLQGFETAVFTDPETGREVLIAAKDAETVNNFVTRADEVGLQQAAGEVLKYADPTGTTAVDPTAVALQQVNDNGDIVDEQLVTQDTAANVTRIPNTQTRVVPGPQALMERTQAIAQEAGAAPAVTQGAPEAPLQSMARGAVATASPVTDEWVLSYNQQLGQDPAAPTAINPASIQEVKPSKAQPELQKLARAMKEAFGVQVVFVQTPQGGLVRNDGTQFGSFNGIAAGNKLFMNVDAATPLNTFGHELAHILKNEYPEIYAKLELTVLSRLSYQRASEFKRSLTQAINAEGNTDPQAIEREFRDELVAEAVGEMTQDQAFWADLFSGLAQDTAAAKSLYDKVIEMLQRLAKALTKAGFISGVKDAQKVRRAITDAYIEWSAATENPNNLTAQEAQMLRQFEKAGGVTSKQSKPGAQGDSRLSRMDVPQRLSQGEDVPLREIAADQKVFDAFTALKERISRAGQMKGDFDGAIRMIAEATGTRAVLAPVKGFKRAFEKVWYDYNGDAGKIKDLLRATIVFSTPEQLDAVLAEVPKMFPGAKPKRNGYATGAKGDPESGYRDVFWNLEFNGMVVELQANHPEMLEAKEKLHKEYEFTRSVVAQYPMDQSDITGIKSAAWLPPVIRSQFLTSLAKQRVGYGAAFFKVLEAEAKNSSRPIGVKPSSTGNDRRTPRYEPSDSTMMQANAVQQSTAPSSLKNALQPSASSAAVGVDSAISDSSDTSTDYRSLTRFSRETISRAIAGERTGPMIVSDAPTQVLRQFLSNDIPITIDDSIIRKIGTGKFGDRAPLSVDQIMDIKKHLTKPVAVFMSKTRDDSIVVLTDMIIDGLPVVLPIVRKSTNTYTVDVNRIARRVTVTSSPIASAYPKDLVGLKNWVADGLLRYWNKDISGKPGFPPEVHAWLTSGARFMGKPVPSLKTGSATTEGKGNAPIASTAQQQQPTGKIVAQRRADFKASSSFQRKEVAPIRSIEELREAAESMSSWRTWYDTYEAYLEGIFGGDTQLFKKLLSATSQAASVPANVGLALKAYRQYLSGEPFEGYLEGVKRNLDRVANEQALTGRKIGEYGRANDGDDEGIAIDRHVSEAIFGSKTPSAAMTTMGQSMIRQIAKELGWKPKEVQASLWAWNITRKGGVPESYDAQIAKPRNQKRIEELRAEFPQGFGSAADRSAAASADAATDGATVPGPSSIEADGIRFSRTKFTELDPVKEITLMDLVGRKVFPVFADLTAAGELYMGQRLLGGPFFSLLPQFSNSGIVWANDGAAITGRKANLFKEGATVGIVVAMTDVAHSSNASLSNIIFSKIEQAIDAGQITTEGMYQLNQLVNDYAYQIDKATGERKLKTKLNKETGKLETTAAAALATFPGLQNRAEAEAWLRSATFDTRAEFFERLGQASAQNLGVPDFQKVLRDSMEETLSGLNKGDAIMAIEFDAESAPVELGKGGTEIHPSYKYGLKGKVIGKFKRPIGFRSIWKDWYSRRRESGANPSLDYRSLQLSMSPQIITKEIASTLPGESYQAIKSPAHAMLADAILSGRVAEMPKTGAGLAAFIRNAAFSDLALQGKTYTVEEAKPLLKAGALRVFSVAGTRADKDGKPDNNRVWLAMERIDGAWSVTSIVNNEPGTGHMLDAMLALAVQKGAERIAVTDASSEKYPEGRITPVATAIGFTEQDGSLVWSGNDRENIISSLAAEGAKGIRAQTASAKDAGNTRLLAAEGDQADRVSRSGDRGRDSGVQGAAGGDGLLGSFAAGVEASRLSPIERENLGLPPDALIRFSRRTKPAPEKTVKAYKLFRVDARRPGQLFPLFVDANTPVDLGVWLDAEVGELNKDGKVKSKIGPLAYRPGWHAGDLPLATHIGGKSSSDLKKPDVRPADQVWAEIEMAADVDWQEEANRRGINKNGRLVPVNAHITDQLPEDGFYRYKTNANMTGNWLIGGSIKVNRILSDDEVSEINSAAGAADLPRQQPFDAKKFGLDSRFSRNTNKLMTVQEVLDFANTGKLNPSMSAQVARGQYAAALMNAKNRGQIAQLLSDAGDLLIRTFADAMLPMQRWIESLPVSDLMRQRLAGDLRRADTMRMAMEREVKSRFAEDMYKAIEKIAKQTGMTADEVKKAVGTWMSAKYAPKANRHLIAKDRAALLAAQRSGDPAEIAKAQRELAERLADVAAPVGFTGYKRGVAGGFSNATAAAVQAGIEAKIDVNLLNEAAAPLYAMLRWKRQKDLDSGRITQQMINGWPNHADYVPLTGDPRISADFVDVFQSGNTLNQDADKAMNGRKDSVADDAIDATFTAVVKSINFAAMQDFKRTLNDVYVSTQRAGQDIGLEREAIKGLARTSDNMILYRDNVPNANGTMGQRSYAFRFTDPSIVASIKKANIETVNAAIAWIQTPTRWYGRLVTQFMPVFAPINFIRDIWERSELVRTRDIYDQNGNKVDVGKVARRSIAQSLNPQLWSASTAYNFDTSKRSALRSELEEFIKLGGSSTMGDYLARAASDLEADIRANTGVTAAVAKKTMEKIEGYNNVFELVPVLAIYTSLKQEGVSPKDAAAATLDLMNFRKRGTAMPAIRSLFVFAQPAAQSGYNLARYLSTPVGQRRFMAQVVVATAVYAMLAGMWGEEDEEELGNKLDNLSNFTVERSIPVKFGDMIVKIPVGFGAPQMAWAYGGIINRITSGRYTPAEGFFEAAKGWIKAVAPVAPSDLEISKRPLDWLQQTLTPTVIKPLMNIVTDQTGMGVPLTPQFKDPSKMNFEQAKRNTPTFYKELAKDIHSQFGIDMYPDHIKAIVDGYAIGPAREIIAAAVDNPSKALRGEPGRVPLVASIVDNINDRSILNSIYYRNREDLEAVHKEFSSRQADGTLQGWLTPERMRQALMFKQFESQERVIGRMRGNLDKMNLPEDVYTAQRTMLEQRADEVRKQLLLTVVKE